MDAQGHVNNARFADYLQEARADFLLASPVPHMLGGGVVVLSHQIEFLAPIEFSTRPVEIDVSVDTVKRAQFSLAYDIRHDGVLCARARTRLCPYDFATQGVRRLTPDEHTFFTSAAEPAEPFRPLARPALDEHSRGTPLRVRWGDLDSYGHVNNVQFFEYVQEGRIAFSTAAAAEMQRMTGTTGRDTMWLVVRQDIEYRQQLAFRPEPYEVRTGVASLGTSSATFAVEVRDPVTGTVYATAATVLVCADAQGRPKPIPDPWKESLAPYRLGR
jgi:acyl-CoA thioester hydrolase